MPSAAGIGVDEPAGWPARSDRTRGRAHARPIRMAMAGSSFTAGMRARSASYCDPKAQRKCLWTPSKRPQLADRLGQRPLRIARHRRGIPRTQAEGAIGSICATDLATYCFFYVYRWRNCGAIAPMATFATADRSVLGSGPTTLRSRSDRDRRGKLAAHRRAEQARAMSEV